MNTAKKRGRPPKQRVEKPVQETQPVEAEPQEEPVKVEPLRVFARVGCQNPTLIEARHGGEKLLIRVPKRIRQRLIGKMIYIAPVDVLDGQVIYEYVQQ